MIKFIIKRIIMMIPVLLGITLLIFTMLYFSPGEAAEFILGERATAEDKALFNKQNGLDEPFFVQFFNYVKNAVTKGDLGTSYTSKQPVTKELLIRFPTTMKLATFSIIIAILIGVTTGIIAATKQYSIWDNICTVISMIAVSMPNFWLGMVLIIMFSVNLGWLPASGFKTPLHWILPSVTVGASTAASIMRMTRSSMLEAIHKDYVRTARAKGQNEGRITWVHALKNALIPIVTVVGMRFGALLGGAVLTETVFGIPGIGKFIVDAIKLRNAPVVQGGIVFLAVTMSLVTLLVDIIYAFIDPRIRSQYVRSKNDKEISVGEEEADNG